MDSKDKELTELSGTEFRSIWSKLIHNTKEDSNKGISGVRKSIQDLDKKVSNIDEKFSEEIEIMKKVEIKLQNNEDSNINSHDQGKEKI
jgi:hypothetical protein